MRCSHDETSRVVVVKLFYWKAFRGPAVVIRGDFQVLTLPLRKETEWTEKARERKTDFPCRSLFFCLAVFSSLFFSRIRGYLFIYLFIFFCVFRYSLVTHKINFFSLSPSSSFRNIHQMFYLSFSLSTFLSPDEVCFLKVKLFRILTFVSAGDRGG